jgi:putative FmdB family regulatory protein
MPTYDYVCGACGHAFEHFQSMSDKTLRTCPKCSKKKLVRQVGAGAGLIFKGTGWYATDYRKSSPASSESKEAESKESESKESESKAPSDSKATSDSKTPSDSKAPAEPKAPATSKGGETSTGGKRGGKPASGPGPRGRASGGGGKDA